MSRHLLVDRPRLQVVVGFDHMLRSFFGQLFNPAADTGSAIDGWPTRSGLGTRHPADTQALAAADLRLLFAWARKQQPIFVWHEPEASEHFGRLHGLLRSEWETGEDAPVIPVPACLQGER